MKIGKLKKRTVKELEKLRSDIYTLQDKFDKRINLVSDTIDEAIAYVATFEMEKKSKKVKAINVDTSKTNSKKSLMEVNLFKTKKAKKAKKA